jgi:hypothetical protein
MTAAVFARQGYFLAKDVDDELRPGDEHNPSGYFEAKGLVEHNARLLRRSGFTGHNTWLFDPITDAQADTLRRLSPTPEDHAFAKEHGEHRPWLWKDPRLCYTLAYWWRLIDQENTRVLVLRRRPEETWNSFVRLDWRADTEQDRADVLARINHHLDAAMRCIEQHRIPHIVVHYDEYLAAPATTAARIGETFGLSLGVDDLGFDKSLNSTRFPRRVQTFLSKQKSKLASHIPGGVLSAIRDIGR